MRTVELTGEIPARPQPLGRIGLGERHGEAPVDGVTLVDGQFPITFRRLCKVQRWIRARSPNTLTTALLQRLGAVVSHALTVGGRGVPSARTTR